MISGYVCTGRPVVDHLALQVKKSFELFIEGYARPSCPITHISPLTLPTCRFHLLNERNEPIQFPYVEEIARLSDTTHGGRERTTLFVKFEDGIVFTRTYPFIYIYMLSNPGSSVET